LAFKDSSGNITVMGEGSSDFGSSDFGAL